MRKHKLSKDVRDYLKKLASKPEAEDECPCCHSKNCFDYPEGGKIIDEGVSYKWDCMKCGATGEQVFERKFTSHIINAPGDSERINIAKAKRALKRKAAHAIARP